MVRTAMAELVERIKASLENPNGEPWFPELTSDLAARGWDNLYRDVRLTSDSYSTERVLSRSISAPREIIASLKTCRTTCATPSAISVEALTPKTLIKYRDQGANFCSPQEFSSSALLSCLEDALAIISEVPSLMRTVVALVRSLHVIRPEDADYDVSFSEPHIPFSIFVSVPEKRIPNDALRVAEAIVHEAMHLQLTLLEKVVLLALPSTNRYFSPWRNEFRDARGLLHGIYVFSVIDRFLEQLLSTGLTKTKTTKYLMARRRKIRHEMAELKWFSYSPDLTITGAYLAGVLVGRQNGPRITVEHPRPLMRNARNYGTA